MKNINDTRRTASAADPHTVTVTVNGTTYQDVPIDARRLLSDFLREDLGLQGTHVGCEQGACGACTVILDGRTVRSCLTFAVQVDGGEILTIEGLADGEQLHPLQAAFNEHHGLQCGFCTPGMVLTAKELLERFPDADEARIRRIMNGNICRCTGYSGIVKAIQSCTESGIGGNDDNA